MNRIKNRQQRVKTNYLDFVHPVFFENNKINLKDTVIHARAPPYLYTCMAGFNSLLIRRVQVSSNGEKDGKNLDWVQLFAPLKSLHLTPLLKMPPRKSVEIQYYFYNPHRLIPKIPLALHPIPFCSTWNSKFDGFSFWTISMHLHYFSHLLP